MGKKILKARRGICFRLTLQVFRKDVNPPRWPGGQIGHQFAPLDTPICGFRGELCSDTQGQKICRLTLQSCFPCYKSPTALLDMHQFTGGISSLLHSVNFILFTVLLVHLIVRISPHRSHHLWSHHLSLHRPLHYRLKIHLFHKSFPL